MFEAIYIAPSSKHAKEFISRFSNRLKDIGIDVYNIDYRTMRIINGNFNISAIDIWSCIPARCRFELRYYIDGISKADFYCEKQKENAMEKLNCIKCCFREYTKEISDEELVKILRENNAEVAK